MSDTDSSPEARELDLTQPRQPSLTELFRVPMTNDPMAPDSTPGDNDIPEDATRFEWLGDNTVKASSSSRDGSSTPELAAAHKGENGVMTPAKAVRASEPKHFAGQRKPQANNIANAAWRASGLGLAGVGGLLVVLPHISTQIAELLANHSDVRAQSGMLIVAGLGLFIFGLVRSTLRDIRSSVEAVSSETAHLKEIAAEGHVVRNTLETLSGENTALTQEVVLLQAELKTLVGIVLNPDYTGSIFRLAASVDQLGKHVDTSLKGQFGQLQKKVLAIAEHAEHAEKRLTLGLGEIPTLMKDQHKAQQLAAQKGLDQLLSAAEESEAQLDRNLQASERIELAIQSQQEQMTGGLAKISANSEQSVRDMGTCLNELQGHLDRLIETQAASTRTEFGKLDSRLTVGERSQASGIAQIAEQVKRQISGHVENLQQSWSLLSALYGHNHRELAEGFGGLSTRFDQHTHDHLISIRDARDQALDATASVKNELEANLARLEAKLEQHSRDQKALVQGISDVAQQTGDATKHEIAACLEELGVQLEVLQRDQLEGLSKSTQATREAAGAANQELSASLVQIESKLVQQARHQQELAVENSLVAQQAGEKTRRELALCLEQLRVQLDVLQRDQREGLSKSTQETREAAGVASQVLAASLDQLETRLVQQSRDHEKLLVENSLLEQQVGEAVKREFAACLEVVVARIEDALKTRSTELTNDMLEVAASFNAITTEVRGCIAEAIRQVADAQIECAANVVSEIAAAQASAETRAGSHDAAPSPLSESPADMGSPISHEPSIERDEPLDWNHPFGAR